MNDEQSEELEALGYIFNDHEFERDGKVLEFKMNECEGLKIQIVWPDDYPTSALLVSITDQRVAEELRLEIERQSNDLVFNN
jgi:RWD domain